jgi:hypothetical protein
MSPTKDNTIRCALWLFERARGMRVPFSPQLGKMKLEFVSDLNRGLLSNLPGISKLFLLKIYPPALVLLL